MIQTDLNPTVQQRACEALNGLWMAFWNINEDERSKVHIITRRNDSYSPLCNCWHPTYMTELDIYVEPWEVECGNCRRIYLSLVRKCITGR